MRSAAIPYALAGVFALCVPLLGIYPVFMMQLLCFAMFACAYNLLLGFSGMLSFGHAAFFGSAAYATAWLATAITSPLKRIETIAATIAQAMAAPSSAPAIVRYMTLSLQRQPRDPSAQVQVLSNGA